MDAGPHTPVAFPLAPHGACTRVPWILDELAQLAADDRLDVVRQGVKRRNGRRLSPSPAFS